MDTTTLSVTTGDRFAVVDLTDEVAGWISGRGSGLCHLLALHATAGLALIETGSGTERDLQTVVEGLLPSSDDAYRHRHGRDGHGGDHVLPAFVSPSLSVPVLDGRLVTGTWQSIVLVDPNTDNPERRVHAAFLPAA